jgi:hypothetical protein
MVDKDDRFFDLKETDEADHQKIKKCIRDYLNEIKQEEPEITQEPSAISQLKKERYNLLNEILQEVVKSPIDSIRDIVQEKTGFKLDNNIFKLIELLKNRITPVYAKSEEELSTFTECDIASILNAGWIFWLTHERELAQEKDNAAEVVSLDKLRTKYYEPLVEISNLVLKGIELTDFNAQFSDRKAKLKAPQKN